jgi:hypothetical protein
VIVLVVGLPHLLLFSGDVEMEKNKNRVLKEKREKDE